MCSNPPPPLSTAASLLPSLLWMIIAAILRSSLDCGWRAEQDNLASFATLNGILIQILALGYTEGILYFIPLRHLYHLPSLTPSATPIGTGQAPRPTVANHQFQHTHPYKVPNSSIPSIVSIPQSLNPSKYISLVRQMGQCQHELRPRTTRESTGASPVLIHGGDEVQ
ncbi:hypothetical protein F4810DRAFT_143240 [Camillea tinctor]|nr:hypothetical protein F4810DRAFT_143240 [Camillea tinctor]